MPSDISDSINDYDFEWFKQLVDRVQCYDAKHVSSYTMTTIDDNDASEVSKLKNALRRMAADIIKNYDYPISIDEFVNKYLEEENNNNE